MNLYEEWLHAKEQERLAVNARRQIEDKMIESFGFNDQQEGTKSFTDLGYKIKATTRINRKVDSDLVQEIAAENGLSEHLPHLFRWKPELNMSAWKNADESITKPLAQAITAKPGRPSFTITKEEN